MKFEASWAYAHITCFIFSFTDIAKLLTKFTEEKQALLWAPVVEAGFQTEGLSVLATKREIHL
jgi:hypothetical protein